jgi:hypothetical protein
MLIGVPEARVRKLAKVILGETLLLERLAPY